MGYAFIMFVLLLFVSVMMVTAINYGIMKDNQIVPLKAKNIYAERETGKAQTGLTIVNTCLSQKSQYTAPPGQPGFNTLNLIVRNNGSIVLNPTKATMLFNNSYRDLNVASGKAWTPLSNASMNSPDIYIDPAQDPEIRLLLAAENGVSTIAPTSPTNFTGIIDVSFTFTWNASKDDKGIDYYLLYRFDKSPNAVCPITDAIISRIPGNQTSITYDKMPNRWFFVVAIDVEGNMGVPSRTLKCPSGQPSCNY